jgi:hypothetical protein
MSFLESLQKLVPWLSGLPLTPKILITAIVVLANFLFLTLIWTPPPKPQPKRTYEEIWAHGGASRTYTDDTQAFEALVSGFFRTYEEATK